MSDRLKDKVAIVTGAGSRRPGVGNGKAAAILFAREGASVLCVDMIEERAQETVSIIEDEGGVASIWVADVSKQSDCTAMADDGLRALRPDRRSAEQRGRRLHVRSSRTSPRTSGTSTLGSTFAAW